MKRFQEYLSIFWHCKVWEFHKWTSSNQQGIKPTSEQLNSGMSGFAEYAKMYCERCGHVSNLSKQMICKYKNLESN